MLRSIAAAATNATSGGDDNEIPTNIHDMVVLDAHKLLAKELENDMVALLILKIMTTTNL